MRNNSPPLECSSCLQSPTHTRQLTELRSYPSGSFIEKFEQLPSTVPVEYSSGNGSFSGYWVTLDSKSIFEYETAIVWSIYACSTGNPMGMCIYPA